MASSKPAADYTIRRMSTMPFYLKDANPSDPTNRGQRPNRNPFQCDMPLPNLPDDRHGDRDEEPAVQHQDFSRPHEHGHQSDKFEDLALRPDLEAAAEKTTHHDHLAHKMINNLQPPRPTSRTFLDTAGWWQTEYWTLVLCLTACALLVYLLRSYQDKPEPSLGAGLHLDTIIIAMVSVVRISMGAIVQVGVSQAAWNWVSAAAQRRPGHGHHARLQDFGLFADAAGGLWGSLALLWRMKLRHFASVGAFIILLLNGFETFSQQMVTFEQAPIPVQMINETTAAPPPPRTETWDLYVREGYTGDPAPALSTKAAIYSGIMATDASLASPTCQTANCSWPIVPSLAACGACAEISVSVRCNESTQWCTYSMPSGLSVSIPQEAGNTGAFAVGPSQGTVYHLNASDRAYFSVFDMVSAIQSSDQPAVATGAECALWICMQSYDIAVTLGNATTVLRDTHSQSNLTLGRGAGGHLFVNIPEKMNVDPDTRYGVSPDAMAALRSFMAGITKGTATADATSSSFSSDWVEAMWDAFDDKSPDSTGIRGWIDNFARSVTGEIRLHGTTNTASAKSYEGSATEMAPYVRVRWLWTIYPGILVVLSMLFLVRTIWATARAGVPAWKSDALPMLFCRVDRDLREQVVDGMDVPDGLAKKVGHARVGLYKGESGYWRMGGLSELEKK